MNTLKIVLYFLVYSFPIYSHLLAQQEATRYVVTNVIYKQDTMPSVEFEDIVVFSPFLSDSTSTQAYAKLKKTVIKMYPYAQKAAQLLDEVETQTAQMDKRRDQKKYINALEKQMKDQFMDELKNFTTFQGKVLMKMVERETGQPFFETVKTMKNPLYANTFQLVGKRYGYDLKKGFHPEIDPFDRDMEEILRYLEANGNDALGVPTRPKDPNSFVYYDSLPKPEELKKVKKGGNPK